MDDANTGERVSVCQPLVSPTLHHACQIIDNHVTIDRNGTVVLSRLRWKGDRFPTRSLITMAQGTLLVSKPNSRIYCSHSFPSKYANTKVFFICDSEERSLERSREAIAPAASTRRTEQNPRNSRDSGRREALASRCERYR